MDKPSEDVNFNDKNDEKMSAGRYFATRLTTLKPPMHKPPGPFKVLRKLTTQQWLFFLVAFLAWTWDAFDFFTVTMTITSLAKEFDRKIADITWGLTLVLMLRSVGSTIFGIASDRYGRKWPFVINNILFIVLELATGFCRTYKQFLAVRALFGIAMGGIYGNAAATALEDCPAEARGLISGLLQEGYAFGFLLATAFARALVNTTPHRWRPYFWFGACPPVLIIIFRLCLPETQTYQKRIEARQSGADYKNVTAAFLHEAKVVLKQHWIMLVYLVLFLAGMNLMSHGSQDIYPTLLENQYRFSQNAVTVIQVVANLGALAGGVTVGYISQVFGRRFTLISACMAGGALLYPYTFIPNHFIMIAAFFEQFCVQGAWGIIPIHLMELSPDGLKTFIVGTAYQLGNLASSASPTIQATLGERFPIPSKDDDIERYEYGKVVCIFMACVYVYVIVFVFLGPEKLGRNFDDAGVALDSSGKVDAEKAIPLKHPVSS